MNINPCGHRVLVKVKPVEEKTEGGIYLPEDLKRKELTGRDLGNVVAFGPTAYRGLSSCDGGPEEWGVKVGDTVEFNRYDGKVPRYGEINEEYKNFRILNDSDILAVITDEEL